MLDHVSATLPNNEAGTHDAIFQKMC